MHTAGYEFCNKAQGIGWMSPDPFLAGGVWGRDYYLLRSRHPVWSKKPGRAQESTRKCVLENWLSLGSNNGEIEVATAANAVLNC